MGWGGLGLLPSMKSRLVFSLIAQHCFSVSLNENSSFSGNYWSNVSSSFHRRWVMARLHVVHWSICHGFTFNNIYGRQSWPPFGLNLYLDHWVPASSLRWQVWPRKQKCSRCAIIWQVISSGNGFQKQLNLLTNYCLQKQLHSHFVQLNSILCQTPVTWTRVALYKAPSERDPEWMCTVGHGLDYVRDSADPGRSSKTFPKSEAQRNNSKAFFRIGCRKCPPYLPSSRYPQRLLPTETAPTGWAEHSFLIQLYAINPASLSICHNPLLVRLYSITLPLCFRETCWASGNCSFSIREPGPSDSSFSFGLCVSFFHPLTTLVRSTPGTM